jgi:hypothetical protein
MYTLYTTYEDDDEKEYDIQVGFDYYPSIPSVRGEQPSEAEIELLHSYRHEEIGDSWKWVKVDLSEDQEGYIVQECFEILYREAE